MKPLSLSSERISPNGNLMGQGMINLLGNPKKDSLALLVRETAQNSWDARISDTATVRYGVTGYQLSGSQLSCINDFIFKELPADGLQLNKWLENKTAEHAAFIISDRNTVGLTGPTRADIIDDSAPLNFVNFVRNIGFPSVIPGRGGTYGYGRASLFMNSDVRTICIHTHCKYHGETVRRFIAVAIGDYYTKLNQKFTGRHWWGSPGEGEIIEPVTGDDADKLAYTIGLPSFDNGETGTSVLLLAPKFDRYGKAKDALKFIVDNILWWIWPKMIPGGTGKPAMSFHVSWNGSQLPIPDPSNTYPWKHFVDALINARRDAMPVDNHAGKKVFPIRCLRPQKLLGRLSLCRFPAGHVEPPSDQNGDEENGPPVIEPVSHVALMREPELVVKYLQGPPQAGESFRYVGVFTAYKDVDQAFAGSEPPAHDDWNPQSMEKGYYRTYVNVALREIKTGIRMFLTPVISSPPPALDLPLGNLTEYLGKLLPVGGENVDPPVTGKKGEAKAKTAKVKICENKLDIVNGRRAIVITFEVEHVAGSVASRITALTAVALSEGEGSEKEPPRGAEIPRVFGWIDPDNRLMGNGQDVVLTSDKKGQFKVMIYAMEDAAITVKLAAEPVDLKPIITNKVIPV